MANALQSRFSIPRGESEPKVLVVTLKPPKEEPASGKLAIPPRQVVRPPESSLEAIKPEGKVKLE